MPCYNYFIENKPTGWTIGENSGFVGLELIVGSGERDLIISFTIRQDFSKKAIPASWCFLPFVINFISSKKRQTCFLKHFILTNYRCISNPKRCSIVLNVHLSQNTSTIWSITYGIISVQNHSNVRIAATHALTSQCSILIWNPTQMSINIGKKKSITFIEYLRINPELCLFKMRICQLSN